MIKIDKSTTINATFNTDDGQQVAYFSASVSDGVVTNMNMNISNQALYEANKAAARADKAEFDKYVYGVEDEESAEKDVVKDKTK